MFARLPLALRQRLSMILHQLHATCIVLHVGFVLAEVGHALAGAVLHL